MAPKATGLTARKVETMKAPGHYGGDGGSICKSPATATGASPNPGFIAIKLMAVVAIWASAPLRSSRYGQCGILFYRE